MGNTGITMTKQKDTKTMTQTSCVTYFKASQVMVEGEGCACGRATLSFQGTGLGKDHGPVEMGATSMEGR